MALDSYSALQASILSWLARPADPLVQPAVPDMIRLFEAEANRRLKSAGAENIAALDASSGWVILPTNCMQIRAVSIGGAPLLFVPPEQLSSGSGIPGYYTIIGRTLFLGPAPNGATLVDLVFQSGVPPLSDAIQTNWLLDTAPDAYLFGALVEAEVYIGEDQRAQGWLARREAAFAGLEAVDRKLRWAGPLQIRVSGITTGVGGSSSGTTSGDITTPTTGLRTVNPASGTTVVMLSGEAGIYVIGPARAALGIRLPPYPAADALVEISFASPVTALTVQSAEGAVTLPEPTNAYGPGAGLQFRYVDGAWIYWR
jgi:hypothetical protein